MKSKQPTCPCGKKGTLVGHRLYRCPLGHLFDTQPDEGGTHDDRDPSRRAQRDEEIADARRANAANQARNQGGFRL